MHNDIFKPGNKECTLTILVNYEDIIQMGITRLTHGVPRILLKNARLNTKDFFSSAGRASGSNK